MITPELPRTAVVISGGAAKGAYAAGFLTEIFRDHDLARTVDLLSGTSTGALIAPMLALHLLHGRDREPHGDGRLLEVILNNYRVSSAEVFRDEPRTPPWIGLTWILRRVGVDPSLARMSAMIGETGAALDTGPLRQIIDREFTNERLGELIAGHERIECLVNCASAQSGDVVAFSTGDPEMTPARYRDAIYASCLQPVFMPLQPISGSDGTSEEYMDGGVRDIVPIYHAWAHGASRILAIALSPECSPHHRTETRYAGRGPLGALRLFLRVLTGLLMDQVDDDDLAEGRYLAALGRCVELARLHGIAAPEVREALRPLNDRELGRVTRPHPFSSLYVHRPGGGTPLQDDFRWEVSGMHASIDAGRQAAVQERGRIRAFLLGDAKALTLNPDDMGRL
jgi:predicted acylesterase/phospholipase RssA